jgi:hypothetical protein
VGLAGGWVLVPAVLQGFAVTQPMIVPAPYMGAIKTVFPNRWSCLSLSAARARMREFHALEYSGHVQPAGVTFNDILKFSGKFNLKVAKFDP